MNKFLKSLLLIALGIALAWGIGYLNRDGSQTRKEETSFERVIRTNTLRCGYGTYVPQLVRDPNTGALSGYDYEIMNAVGRVLGLKVEWTEETGWGIAEQGLLNKRYDVFCNGVWPTPQRARVVFYSRPFMYTPIFPFVAIGNKKVSQDLAWIDQPDITIVTLRKTLLDTIADTKFPKAKKFDLSVLASDGEIIMAVATGKADVGFSAYGGIKKFMDSNPGQIQPIEQPVMYAPGAFLLPPDDYRLKHMIDFAIAYLVDTGAVRDILLKTMPDSQHGWRYPIVEHEK